MQIDKLIYNVVYVMYTDNIGLLKYITTDYKHSWQSEN